MVQPPWYAAHRDAAITVIGACTGIASLLLVFIGFMLSTADSFPSGTPDAITGRYRTLAGLGLIPFALSVIVMLAGYFWLFSPQQVWLLKTWAWGFPFVSAVLIVYAIRAVLYG